MSETKTIIQIPDFITVRELATEIDASPIDVIKQLMNNGIMANINQQIDFDTASIVAAEMGYDLAPMEVEAGEEDEMDKPVWKQILAEEKEKDLSPRPPVITMLGHVDHGKTSLLDYIRQANVVEGEAGGITQHIGAYQIERDGQKVTFLDTPGHEAFTAMRARGAKATDIAILVVAADDGMMPQTYEAVDHAKAAGVPIIVAMNKMDLATANPNKVLQQLAEIDLVPDEWDGDTLVIPVSAKQGDGIEDLIEAILLVAEDLEPRANSKASPTGTVLEARQEKGRGVMTTLLVQNGTLRIGDTLLVGENYGRIRAMFDYRGKPVDAVGPATPTSVSGLNGIPAAGDQFEVVESEKAARRIIEEEVTAAYVGEERRAPVSLDEFFSRLQEGETKSLNLIIKADVQGSLEPIVNSLKKIKNDEVVVDILRAATGNVSESDILLAAASDAVVLGFNVEVDAAARVSAASEQVEINTYSIIYKLIEDIEKAMKGMLTPVFADVIIGRAEVRQVFRVRGAASIAGSYMRTGEARRNAKCRVIRGTTLIHSAEVASLRHLTDNVREVKAGFEFGVAVQGFNDFQQGDILEFFVNQRVER